MELKKFVIITGLSGSGKSLVANTFEDINYFVSDNVHPSLLPQMAERLVDSKHYSGFAVVIDRRCEEYFDDLVNVYNELKTNPIKGYEIPVILYLDCDKSELIRRFKETRRKHPLTNASVGVTQAIDLEKEIFMPVLDIADIVIDTTKLEPEELRKKIKTQFNLDGKLNVLNITVSSFGFKHGMPLDPDLVFDVRFLVNPFWVPKLKELTGKDDAVKKYVFKDKKTKAFMAKLYDLVDFCVPEYLKEGKAYLNIAIGCTGGRHRSVAVAEELTKHLQEQGYIARVEHRDFPK